MSRNTPLATHGGLCPCTSAAGNGLIIVSRRDPLYGGCCDQELQSQGIGQVWGQRQLEGHVWVYLAWIPSLLIIATITD